jgi:acyl-CoA synthetase (AMP-forming)/AMP-acid ligase II
VTLRVLDEGGKPVAPGQAGEIVAQGENVMIGYWADPEEANRVLRDEGLWTGDLARVDQDGYIYIVGRKSDVIKTGAYRVNPKEIEDVILELDGVAEVAVVGLPDAIWGEAPVAFIVPSSNGAIPTEREIVEHCRRNLPRYKLVHAVRFADCLPKTPTGKIRRSELQDACRRTSVTADG